MSPRLEHANLAVRNIDATLRFLTTALPEFRLRFDGVDDQGRRWVHVGTDDAYLALYPATRAPAEPWTPYAGVPGVNHIGLVVEDAEAVRRRLTAAGYRDSTVANSHPARRRVYFMDPDGNDWEFVQYLSDDATQRHDYGDTRPHPA
jgi:catechol 2,3-dioxygenase-like lactoylglutathione lyase family enzyme